jgi:hypothetical protein
VHQPDVVLDNEVDLTQGEYHPASEHLEVCLVSEGLNVVIKVEVEWLVPAPLNGVSSQNKLFLTHFTFPSCNMSVFAAVSKPVKRQVRVLHQKELWSFFGTGLQTGESQGHV